MTGRKKREWMLFALQLLLMLGYFLPVYLPYKSYTFLILFGGFLMLAGALVLLTALFQLRNALSPLPSPRPNAVLLTTGIFKYSRHPIYTGLILCFTGFAFYFSNGFKLLYCLLLLGFFYFKSVYEERLLIQRFQSYDDYKKRTRRFL